MAIRPSGNKDGRNQQLSQLMLRLSVILSLPVFVVFLLLPGVSDGMAWDWANGIGFILWVVLLLLFFYDARSRSFPLFRGRFFLNLHRDLGLLTLLLLLLHVLHQLLSEPVMWQHVSLAAPLDMLAAWLAAILLLVLAFSSVSVARRRCWRDYAQFRFWHHYLSLAVVALVAWHILALRFYLSSPLAIALFSASLLYPFYRYVMPRESRLRNTYRLRGEKSDTIIIVLNSTVIAALILLLAIWGREFLS